MKKSLNFVLSVVLSTFMALAAGSASAEAGNSMEGICTSLQKLTKSASDEALARPDKDIFQTKVYTSITAHADKDAYRKVFKEVFSLAQTVINNNGTSEQAGDAVMAACQKT